MKQIGVWRRCDLQPTLATRKNLVIAQIVEDQLPTPLPESYDPAVLHEYFAWLLNTAEEKWHDAIVHAFTFDLTTMMWILLVEPQRFLVAPTPPGKRFPCYDLVCKVKSDYATA